MNINRIDLNLLVFLDVLLEERSVTKAASKLGITQPAMSNGLKRLRQLFNDPLLIRTSEGMTPTDRANELRPSIRQALSIIESSVQPSGDFDPTQSHQVFRIMASDYAESTLIPKLLQRLLDLAPATRLDVLTPSDVVFNDVEQGKIDMAINRFDRMPNSFHQKTVWYDNYSCVIASDNPLLDNYSLDTYINAAHIWVSKTGMGKGVGINPDQPQSLGRVDEALAQFGLKRNIAMFTRHYQVAIQLAESSRLIATIPTRLADMLRDNDKVQIRKPPFSIPPFELKMAWSPLLQHSQAHQWLRQQIMAAKDDFVAEQGNAQ